MAREDQHGIGECTGPLDCPRHSGNVLIQDADVLLVVLEYAKRNVVPGQIPVGSRVEKNTWESGDLHAIGTTAKVIGCLEADGKRGYFVEWQDCPGQLAFVQEYKIRRVTLGAPDVS